MPVRLLFREGAASAPPALARPGRSRVGAADGRGHRSALRGVIIRICSRGRLFLVVEPRRPATAGLWHATLKQPALRDDVHVAAWLAVSAARARTVRSRG